MRPVTVTVSGIGVSAPIPMDYTANQFSVAVGVKISATATYTVEHTFDKMIPNAGSGYIANFATYTPNIFPHSSITAKIASIDGNGADFRAPPNLSRPRRNRISASGQMPSVQKCRENLWFQQTPVAHIWHPGDAGAVSTLVHQGAPGLYCPST